MNNKLKKVLSICTAGLLAFCGGCFEKKTDEPPADFSGIEQEEHVHEWLLVEGETATCEHAGFEKFECITCGELEEKNHKKLEHTYSKGAESIATCTSEGSVTYQCACGASYIETSPMLDHEYELISATEATCTSEGIEVYQCTVCEAPKAVIFPMLDHEWELISSTEPTVDQDGVDEYECSACGATKTVTISHVHCYTLIEYVEATCLTDGLCTYKCDSCETTIEEIEPKGSWGHSYALFRATEPTTPEEGSAEGCQSVWTETYKCVHCEDEYDVTAGGGHTNDRDFVRYATCGKCGYEEATVTKCQDCDYQVFGCPSCKMIYEA